MPGGGWGAQDIEDLGGRVAVVTGATSGIGYETALELAAHGARTVLACRDPGRAGDAAGRIAARTGSTTPEVVELDLACLESVRRAADELGHLGRIDILVNNAGVMGTPRRRSVEGYELQLATNHLGHFALTGLVLGCLGAAGAARVVTVSSLFHRAGRLELEDLDASGPYNPWRAYARSKLANLLFAFELDRRLRAAGSRVLSVAAHPGWARSNLAVSGPAMDASGPRRIAGRLAGRFLGQSAASGALPTLFAAVAPGVRGGDYYGPAGPLEQFGPPVAVGCSARARSGEDARVLWERSEALTEVRYDFGLAASAHRD